MKDGCVGIGTAPDAIIAAISAFFEEHEVASLKLPSGWFGRPYDNWHQLTKASAEGSRIHLRLDQVQVLDLDASHVFVDDRAVSVEIRGGDRSWTSYGGTDKHHEELGQGTVEFHAPFHS